jgi:hypothetical protein
MIDKKIHGALLIIILLLLLSPIALKAGFSEKVFTSDETYLNLIQTNQVSKEAPIHERLTNNNPFHVLTSLIPFDDVTIAFFVPLIMGLISAILIFLILRKFNLSDNETIIALILFALTPIFIFKFTTLNLDNLAFPLFLLTALLYLNKSYFSILPLIIMTFINPILGILFLIFLITKLILNKSNKLTIITIITTTTSLIAYYLINKTILIRTQTIALDDALIELGSMTGYSIPLIILGAIGLFSWWEKGRERTILTASIITGLIISLIIPDIRLIVALALAVFAGIGLNQLLVMKWELKNIKQMALLLILYIILFSSIITINTQLTQISREEVEASKFLSQINTQNKVLSTENKGFMIQYLSGKNTFIDGNSYLEENYDEKIKTMNDIFYSRRLSELEQLLKTNSIEYIFIHEDMKNGRIWTGRDEGLLFFLRESDQFLKIFDNKQVQIYKYKGINT